MKKMLIIPALLVMTLFFSLTDLDAAIVSGCIDSGTSLKGKAKIGSKFIGSNYYYSFTDNSYQESVPDINFCTDRLTDADPPNNTGTISVNFSVDYCINGPNPILNIWSSVYNNVDYTYSLGYSMHLGSESWTYSPCYRSFISLKMNYHTHASVSSDLVFTQLTISGVKFGMFANFGYSPILRYTDLVYYNSADYNAALVEAKKIGQSQQTNSKLEDLNNKQDQTNSKLDDLNSKLTDTTAPDTSGFGNVSGWLPAGPVDSILTLPVKVMNTISGVLAGTCNSVSLPLPFISSNLELPCGDSFYDNITGLNVFLNTLGFILGCYLLYSYLIYLYNWVDKKVSMVENDREKWGAV